MEDKNEEINNSNGVIDKINTGLVVETYGICTAECALIDSYNKYPKYGDNGPSANSEDPDQTAP